MTLSTRRRKKFAPGEYIVVNTGGSDRLGRVVDDWWSTAPHEVRIDFFGNGSRLDLWVDRLRLATDAEVAQGKP